MTAELRVFVSSVQRELEDERLIVQNLLNTDLFLLAHCLPVLYEFEPASPDKATEGCLKALDGCQVYLLIVGIEYGNPVQGLSITHTEYRRAKERRLPILIFIKGGRELQRENGTTTFLAEIDADGAKYKRFGNVVELQKEVRAALVGLLADRFRLAPSSDENAIAEQTIEATSPFESQPLTRVRWRDLDHTVARRLIAAADERPETEISEEDLLTAATLRGLIWHDPAAGEHYASAALGSGYGHGDYGVPGYGDPASGEHYATAAGIVLLGKDPSAVFPQCRILADAYRGNEPDGDPSDQEDIRGPMPLAIDRAIAFIDRNTRHPMRVIGLNRVRLDEYPVEALREALVNAVAHRQYEDAGRKIMLEVLANQVVVSSPGLPPAPITLPSLRSGKYRPCSRNPVLAQCLSYFHRIEERGSGFRRMHDQMLDHGLDPPQLDTNTGYFQVTFPGPGDNLDRLRLPEARLMVTPAVEAQLNERQKKILTHALEDGSVTSGWCLKEFGVVYNTAYRDLDALVRLGLLKQEGRGRGTRYTLPERSP